MIVTLISLVKSMKMVYYDDKGNFRMDREAIVTLQCVKRNLNVIYVYGQECHGKIFILNKVCNENIAWMTFFCVLEKTWRCLLMTIFIISF